MLFRLPRVVRSIVVCPLHEEMNLDVGDLDVLNAMQCTASTSQGGIACAVQFSNPISVSPFQEATRTRRGSSSSRCIRFCVMV